jgi:hypothetical protein
MPNPLSGPSGEIGLRPEIAKEMSPSSNARQCLERGPGKAAMPERVNPIEGSSDRKIRKEDRSAE